MSKIVKNKRKVKSPFKKYCFEFHFITLSEIFFNAYFAGAMFFGQTIFKQEQALALWLSKACKL
jgi:hypothetical protein